MEGPVYSEIADCRKSYSGCLIVGTDCLGCCLFCLFGLFNGFSLY